MRSLPNESLAEQLFEEIFDFLKIKSKFSYKFFCNFYHLVFFTAILDFEIIS